MMSALALVEAQGRLLEERLLRAPGWELLEGLRASGALGASEEAALGPPGGRDWVRRLRAVMLAKGEESCRAMLRVLERLEEPGMWDFYNPRRDAQPSHRSDCPCCHPPACVGVAGEKEEGEERKEEEDGGRKEEDGRPEEAEGGEEDDGGRNEDEEAKEEDEEPEEEEECGGEEEEEECGGEEEEEECGGEEGGGLEEEDEGDDGGAEEEGGGDTE